MDFAFPTDTFDATDFDKPRAARLIAEGWYHMQVEKVDEQADSKCVKLKLMVLSPGAERGRTRDVPIWLKPGDQAANDAERAADFWHRLFNQAAVLGVTSKERFAADKAAGRPHVMNWLDAIGAQFIGEVRHGKEKLGNDGVVRKEVYVNMFRLDDETAKGRMQKAGGTFDADMIAALKGPVDGTIESGAVEIPF